MSYETDTGFGSGLRAQLNKKQEETQPETPQPHFGWLMDLNMLTMTGGRERMLSEYEALLDAAGFDVIKVTATKSPLSVIEAQARPVPRRLGPALKPPVAGRAAVTARPPRLAPGSR